MFLGFTSTRISNNHKLLFLSNLPLPFYQPLLFWGKIYLRFLENKQNSTPHLLCKVGGDPATINQNQLYYFFATKASNNKNNLEFENLPFTELQRKKINDNTCY